MFEVQLLIPVAGNDGITFNAAHHTTFEEFVIDRFGGVTLYPATATGAWVDGGKLYKDSTRVYGIAVRTITDGAKVGEIVSFAKAHYKQEAIFLRYLGVVEIL